MLEGPAPIILKQIKQLDLLDWPISKWVEHVFRAGLAAIWRERCVLESGAAPSSPEHVVAIWSVVGGLLVSLGIRRSVPHSGSGARSLDQRVESQLAWVRGLFVIFFQNLILRRRHRTWLVVFSLHRPDLAWAVSCLLWVTRADATNALSQTLLHTGLAFLEFYFVVLEVCQVLRHWHRHRHFWGNFLGHFSLFRLLACFRIWWLWECRRLLILTWGIQRGDVSWVCVLARLCHISRVSRLILLWVEVVRGKAARSWAFEAWLGYISCRHFWIPGLSFSSGFLSATFSQEFGSLTILVWGRQRSRALTAVTWNLVWGCCFNHKLLGLVRLWALESTLELAVMFCVVVHLFRRVDQVD